MKEPYIPVTYRISREQDKKVKKAAKKKSQSAVIRELIDSL